MESETVLCTYGKLPANQHSFVSLRVSINPTVQDESDMEGLCVSVLCVTCAEFSQLMQGAFESYARQAALLHRRKSVTETSVEQTVVDRTKMRQSIADCFLFLSALASWLRAGVSISCFVLGSLCSFAAIWLFGTVTEWRLLIYRINTAVP